MSGATTTAKRKPNKIPPSPASVTKILTPTTPPTNNEAANLAAFFTHYHASTAYINDYINAANQNHIDYRLLPAISIAESGGGLHACGNNWWGWDSCKGDNFGSVTQGIQYIAQKLGFGSYYRRKTIDQKLRAYNRNPAYAGEVERLMKEISK